MKKLYLLIALVFLTTNVYAVISPDMGAQKFAANDNNYGREHIDIIVRHFADDSSGTYTNAYGGHLTTIASHSLVLASEGAVVIWATQSTAIIGRDVTMTQIASANLVAGIISEPGGIASGSYGRMRIYGYFDDVLAYDASEPVSQGDSLRTSVGFGQVGGGKNFTPSAGIAFDNGAGTDLAEIQAMVNVRN
jgi:hypothetical protein